MNTCSLQTYCILWLYRHVLKVGKNRLVLSTTKADKSLIGREADGDNSAIPSVGVLCWVRWRTGPVTSVIGWPTGHEWTDEDSGQWRGVSGLEDDCVQRFQRTDVNLPTVLRHGRLRWSPERYAMVNGGNIRTSEIVI